MKAIPLGEKRPVYLQNNMFRCTTKYPNVIFLTLILHVRGKVWSSLDKTTSRYCKSYQGQNCPVSSSTFRGTRDIDKGPGQLL